MGGGGGWAAGGGLYTFHKKTCTSAVSSISHRNRQNPQDKQTVVGSTLAPHVHMSLLMPFIGSICRCCNVPSWFNRVGKKPFMKVDLAIYGHYVWCVWIVLVCSIQVNL